MDNDKNQIQDYTKIRLDKNLLPLSSPIVARNSIRGIDFDILNDRGIINQIKVRNVSFSSLTGGTATLGGVQNGNGLLTVKNAGGIEVVRLDNTGIVISAGTISGVVVSNINSGTYTNSFIGTSLFIGGTVKNAVLGTNQLTGGTLNPSVYQTQGTPGISGSFVYVKTVNFAGSTTTLGTVQFDNGIIYSNQ